MLFRKLSKNKETPSIKSLVLLIVPICVVGAIVGCTINEASKPDGSSIFSSAAKFLNLGQKMIEVRSAGSSALLKISQSHCEKNSNESKEITARLNSYSSIAAASIQSSGSGLSVKFNYSSNQVSDRASSEKLNEQNRDPGLNELTDNATDNHRSDIALGPEISPALKKSLDHEIEKLCSQNKTSIAQESVSELINTVADIISLHAPRCSVKVAGDSFYCQKTANIPDVLATLSKTNKDLLRKIKRPPYALMRKLNLTRQLAESATSKVKVLRICELAKRSLIGETPLVMRTPEWSEGLCRQLATEELGQAHISEPIQSLIFEAVSLAKDEVVLLKALAVKKSYRGIISLKFSPEISAGKKNFYVELFPSGSVLSTIESGLNVYNSKSLSDNKITNCWHPFATDGSDAGASLVGLEVIKSDQITCATNHSVTKSTLKKLAGAITGDSKFIVSNHHGKILNLPKGDYDFEVSSLPSDRHAYTVSSGRIHKTGSIAWTGARYTTIR